MRPKISRYWSLAPPFKGFPNPLNLHYLVDYKVIRYSPFGNTNPLNIRFKMDVGFVRLYKKSILCQYFGIKQFVLFTRRKS
jgi:hypothetical protein